MNFRFTAALLGGVLLVVVVLLVIAGRDDKDTQTDVLAAELVAVGAKAEDIDTVEIEKADGSAVVLVRTNKDQNAWQIQKPISAKADGSKVTPIISALLRAKPTTYAELSSNPAVHGLEPVGVKVTIRKGQERSSTVNLGDVTMGDKGVAFVTTSSQSKRPMAVRRSDLDPLFRDGAKDGKAVDLVKWTSDFRTQSVFPADSRALGEDVALLKLELPNKKKELVLSRAPDGGWKFDSPAGWGAADTEGDSSGLPDKFTGVGPLLRALSNVAAGVPADFIDESKGPAEYGLNADNPDRIRVEMKLKDGQTAVAYLGKFEGGAPPPAPKDAKDVTPPPLPTPAKVYVSVDGLTGFIRASAVNLSGLGQLITDPSPLRDRNLLNVSAGKQVDGIDILLPGQAPDQPTKLRKVGAEWKLYGGRNDPQTAYLTAATRLADVLSARRSIKDFPGPNPADFAAVAATLFVWVDGFNPPIADKAEPGKKAEPVKLEFGRVEGETVYVRRTLPGGAVNVFALPTSVKVGAVSEQADVMKSVAVSRLDLLDRSLPSFSDSAPVRITVNGVTNYVLARDEPTKDDKPGAAPKETLWRFVEPPERKGQVADGAAVRDLINLLATSQSAFDKFVDEGGTDPGTYNLASPRLKVVIDLGGKDNTRGFEFGRDATDADKVYARVVGKPAVFTMQRRALDRFANPDLRDRVIFRGVPVGQVTSAEFVGWGGITLKFEKNKDGVWTPQPPTPPAFAVDPAKLNAFVELLSRAPIKTFEPGKPDAKHGFGDPKVSLTARLKWAGGEAYVNLGASPDNGATYYGWTSSLPAPDQIFTIDAALFKPYKDGPGGFAK